MKTIKFFASLGVVAGYGHNNETPEPAEVVAGKVWQEIAAAVQQATQSPTNKYGTYIGAVISSSKTVYHTDWGCPVGGEDTVFLTGECNPEFTELAAYKTAATEVLRQVGVALKQKTTQICFVETEFEYLKLTEE
ncbi:MAG: hypothetical protein WCT50_04555 [Patescibacteria group bacterium]